MFISFLKKAFLIQYLFILFSFGEVVSSSGRSSLSSSIHDLIASMISSTNNIDAVFENVLKKLIEDDTYNFEFKKEPFSISDYLHLMSSFIDFYEQFSKKKEEDSIIIDFLQSQRAVIKGRQISKSLISFLVALRMAIGARIEAKEAFENYNKKNPQISAHGVFSPDFRSLFSSFSDWEESKKKGLMYISKGKEVPEKKGKKHINIAEKISQAKSYRDCIESIKKDIDSAGGASVLLDFVHVKDYNFNYISTLESFLEDIKNCFSVDDNVIISCATNFSDVASVYKKVFIEGNFEEAKMSFFADSFISARHSLSSTGNIYMFAPGEEDNVFSLDGLYLHKDVSHKIYFFIDGDHDPERYEDFVKKVKQKNPSYSIEVIPVYQEHIAPSNAKKIPSIIDYFAQKKENTIFERLTSEEKNVISLMLRASGEKITFSDLKNACQSSQTFDQLKAKIVHLHIRQFGSGCSFLKKNNHAGPDLVSGDLFCFPANEFYNGEEEMKRSSLDYLSKIVPHDSVVFDFSNQLKNSIDAIVPGHSIEQYKKALIDTVSEYIKKISFDPALVSTKKYFLVDAYYIKSILEKKVRPALQGIYNSSASSRSDEESSYAYKVDKDLASLSEEIIGLFCQYRKHIPLVFSGPQSMMPKDRIIIEHPLNFRDIAKKLFRLHAIPEVFSLYSLSSLPLPYYFSFKQKKEIIDFARIKFSFYKKDISNEHERMKLFFHDEAMMEIIVSEINAKIKSASDFPEVDYILKEAEVSFPPFFLNLSKGSFDSVQSINVEKEQRDLCDSLKQIFSKEKVFYQEHIQKLHLGFVSIGIRGEQQSQIIKKVFEDQKYYDLCVKKLPLEIVNFIIAYLHYRFLDENYVKKIYTVSNNSFFQIQKPNPDYESSLLHSKLADYINQEFALFKKDNTYCMKFNIGGITGSGKSQGINEVIKKLKEVTGSEPVAILVKSLQDKYVGSINKYFDQLWVECRKFITKGKYVILNFEELDAFLAQGNGYDGARDAKMVGEFKKYLQWMTDEFGSKLIPYATSNKVMITGDKSNNEKNIREKSIHFDQALLGRFGLQQWLPSVEHTQYSRFYKGQIDKLKKVYKNSSEYFISFLKHIEVGKSSFDLESFSLFYNVLCAGGSASGGAAVGLRDDAFMRLLLDHLDKEAEKRGNQFVLKEAIRNFANEEIKKNFKEGIKSILKLKVEDLTQLQPAQRGKEIADALAALLTGAGKLYPEKDKVFNIAGGLVKGGGFLYDNTFSNQEIAPLAIRSDKPFVQSFIKNEDSLYEIAKKINALMVFECYRHKVSLFKKEPEFLLQDISSWSNFIFKCRYGVPLDRDTVTHGVESRSWLTDDKIKNKLSHIHAILNSFKKEDADFYKAILVDEVSSFKIVHKGFLKDKLSYIDNHFADESHKKELLGLIRKHSEAKIAFSLDREDAKKMKAENDTYHAFIKYIKILNGNSSLHLAREKIEKSESILKNPLNLFTNKKNILK
jgi:hypothetical protein